MIIHWWLMHLMYSIDFIVDYVLMPHGICFCMSYGGNESWVWDTPDYRISSNKRWG